VIKKKKVAIKKGTVVSCSIWDYSTLPLSNIKAELIGVIESRNRATKINGKRQRKITFFREFTLNSVFTFSARLFPEVAVSADVRFFWVTSVQSDYQKCEYD